MADVAAWVKQHKTATAGIAAGAVLVFILLRRGGATSASGSASPLQIAQLQSAQNLQMAQIQAQQNVATEGEQVQVEQTNAQLQAEQNQAAVGLALELNQSGSQNKALEEEIAARNADLSLALPEISALQKRGGSQNSQSALDELALILEEPQGISYSSFGPQQPSLLNSFLAGLGNGVGNAAGTFGL